MKTLINRPMVALKALALISIHVFSSNCTAYATRADLPDHLDPVDLTDGTAYRTKLESLLFITAADYARMSVRSGSDLGFTEFVVSVYSHGAKRNEYRVTTSQASENIWDSMPNRHAGTDKPIKVNRCDAEMPSSTAFAIRRVWKHVLRQTRPHDYSSVDQPTGGEIVEFSIVEGRRTLLLGRLAFYPGKNTLALQQLGISLMEYCKASPSHRPLLAKKIEDEAKKLLSEKPSKLIIR